MRAMQISLTVCMSVCTLDCVTIISVFSDVFMECVARTVCPNTTRLTSATPQHIDRDVGSAFGSSITDVRLRPILRNDNTFNMPQQIKMKRFNSNMFDHVNVENTSELRLPVAKGT